MSKYRAVKTTIDGIKFDSKAEANHYLELKTFQNAGVISDLCMQVSYEIIVNGKRICKYYADFQFVENGVTVVEDVKGVRTAVYRIKKKLVEALYGIEIVEVK